MSDSAYPYLQRMHKLMKRRTLYLSTLVLMSEHPRHDYMTIMQVANPKDRAISKLYPVLYHITKNGISVALFWWTIADEKTGQGRKFAPVSFGGNPVTSDCSEISYFKDQIEYYDKNWPECESPLSLVWFTEEAMRGLVEINQSIKDLVTEVTTAQSR